MNLLPISICILSWNNRISLSNSLKSYKKNGLLDITDDVTILFQQVSKEDVDLANRYGVKYIGEKNNIGIGKGIIKLLENTKHQHVLFLEQDFELLENKENTYYQLSKGLEFIKKGYHVVRYRHRKKPGYPLFSLMHKGKELEYYDDWHKVTSPHLLESIHWLDPAESFPDKIQKDGDFFITTSRWANWTNNPFLLNKEFYLKTLTPFAGEGVHFERNIAPWWVQQNFKIAQGEGLFTHNDLKKYPKPTLVQKLKNIIKKIHR